MKRMTEQQLVPLWIYSTLNEKEKSSDSLCNFLAMFYNELEKYIECCSNEYRDKEYMNKSQLYKQEVFKLLEEHKLKMPLSDIELREIQIQIEDLTMAFNEVSIFKQVPNLIKILIQNDKQSAKDYLYEKLSKDDQEMLNEFGQYTLEALIIHVLGILYNQSETESSMVRASSLIDRLDSSVRTHSKLLKSHITQKSKENQSEDDTKRNMYSIGAHLLEFMKERELVSFQIMDSVSGVVKKKSKGGYYIQSNLFVVCEFDISLLPIKLNLPMICPPEDWKCNSHKGDNPRYLSDLSGGYLSGPTGEIYDRYRLLSSGDLNNFYIYLGDSYSNNYKSLCKVMNTLQRQPFSINSEWLNYLLEYEDQFVDKGILMPRYLECLNIRTVYPLLREFHMNDDKINKEFSFNDILNTVLKNIQRCRYDLLIINLARAYSGYNFYLPAFLDFRGRIYRCGILHFHERDLARSLIIFANLTGKKMNTNSIENKAYLTTIFHFFSFNSIGQAYSYLTENGTSIITNLYDYTALAKRPFQFFANMLFIDKQVELFCSSIPITQDASSSAYQIMSYFLLNETIAERTNLIPFSDGQIQDIYLFMLEELKDFMKGELDENLCMSLNRHLNRKIVKGIFMPIIYGKTIMSTATDLMTNLSQHITRKECFRVASVCFKYFKEKYPGMDCLIRLIRLIGWVASARDSAVLYNANYFTTVQDYMKMEPLYIWVYDRVNKKRRRVNLRVSSDKRDRRKTETSTFVNFIHQKDAFIAMKVVEEMLDLNAPIYTVHDNFITTADYSDYIPMLYLKVFRDLGPPLSIINKFIYMNIIRHLRIYDSYDYGNIVIPKKLLSDILNHNIPINISKQNRIIWDKKISEIVSCYSNYSKIVCGSGHTCYKDSWDSHVKMWNNFAKKLSTHGPNRTSYCVHY